MVSTSHNERPLFDGHVYAFYILLPSSDNQVNSNEVKRLVFNVNSALNKKVSEGEISILLDKLQKKLMIVERDIWDGRIVIIKFKIKI